MTEIRYSGWFQCRLATDPDPYDEPRGVSGYVHAYAGEPDLDRVIRFHDPGFDRSHGVDVGVYVDSVVGGGVADPTHPLVGARVDLLGNPKYEGRNGVVADDGLEPVYPFEIAVTHGDFRLTRAVTPQDTSYPYPELYSIAFDPTHSAEIASLTGVPDLPAVWRHRRALLTGELGQAPEPGRTAIQERIAFLDRNLAADRAGAAGFFGVRMHYLYTLASTPQISDLDGWLPEAAAITEPWPVAFWFGGWDADLLCGFTSGTIYLGSEPEQAPQQWISEIRRRP